MEASNVLLENSLFSLLYLNHCLLIYCCLLLRLILLGRKDVLKEGKWGGRGKRVRFGIRYSWVEYWLCPLRKLCVPQEILYSTESSSVT